ncbi:RDD family protein [Arthrobacter sp. Helios]|uniref:RDD family protein n=1 Tax=Arthrobacter sp. Helios TaxID=2828862 RepID=UPI002067535A|nr:RDD family protein [Arthrobacter sp. Helios]UPO77686.1 RDD family protein [Arthrobacter sp. Helios]
MATNPNLVNATAGQRLAARAVDSVPLLVLALVVLSIPGRLALILCAVGAAAYLLWLWLWEAGSGQTPGNRLLGLRTVAVDGNPPGFPAALVRNLLLLASAVTVVGPWILTVSNLWDYPHRRQGWHDKAARTLMVDIRAGRNPLLTGGRWIQGAPGPELAAESGAAASGGAGPVAVAAGVRAAGPAAPAAFASASSSAAARAGSPTTPAGDPAGRIGAGFPAPGNPGQAPAAEESTGSGPISSVPGVARPAAAPAQAQASAQVSPSAQASALAAFPMPAPAADRSDDEDDVEMTRVVSRPRGAGRLLTFDDGATVRVAGTALLGRNPAAGIGESTDQLIDFADMGRSVSKTHLHLQADGASGLWVTDRNSTNGSSIVAPDGRHVALEAHSPILAPTGSTVYFGDRHFTVA